MKNTISVSNSSDPDHDRQSVRPDLGPNCLQRLSADDKVAASKKIVNTTGMHQNETKKMIDRLNHCLSK